MAYVDGNAQLIFDKKLLHHRPQFADNMFVMTEDVAIRQVEAAAITAHK